MNKWWRALDELEKVGCCSLGILGSHDGTAHGATVETLLVFGSSALIDNPLDVGLVDATNAHCEHAGSYFADLLQYLLQPSCANNRLGVVLPRAMSDDLALHDLCNPYVAVAKTVPMPR